MTFLLAGRRKGYRPNRIRMEQNLDQQEATDLTSKHRNSIHVIDDQPTQNYQASKARRIDTAGATPTSPKPSSHHDQPKQPTLNIRSDLKKLPTSLESTNLMSSVHKGLEAFGGENNHQVKHMRFTIHVFIVDLVAQTYTRSRKRSR